MLLLIFCLEIGVEGTGRLLLEKYPGLRLVRVLRDFLVNLLLTYLFHY